jgi:RNA polymerase sigma factor for flagellar operon FliA
MGVRMDTNQLWNRYHEARDVELRNRIVEENLRLVHHVARQVLGYGTGHGDLDELVSAGTMGLIEAVENFDPERGLAFSTFAAPRIRGAILDDHRRRDHVPRSVRRKQRDLKRARDRVSEEHGRPARNEEVAEELGVDLETVWQWDLDTRSASWVSLDRPLNEDDGRSATAEEVVAGDEGTGVEDELTRGQELDIVRAALDDLGEQQRTVLALYYFEELKLHQIASILGVTESRISQVRSKALGVLRERLAHVRTAVEPRTEMAR